MMKQKAGFIFTDSNVIFLIDEPIVSTLFTEVNGWWPPVSTFINQLERLPKGHFLEWFLNCSVDLGHPLQICRIRQTRTGENDRIQGRLAQKSLSH